MALTDIESAVFSPISQDFRAAYPNGSCYGEITEAPANFPALIIYEADRASTEYTGLDAERLVFDVDVYSNLTSGAKQECKDIIGIVENRLMSFGKWELVFCEQLKNADQRIFRMKARYRCTAVQEEDTDGNVVVRIYRR